MIQFYSVVLISIFGKTFPFTKSGWSSHGVCGGKGPPVPQVVAEAAGIGSLLAPDQIIGKTTVDIMVVLPIFLFLVSTFTNYRSFAYIVRRPLKSICLHFIALT